MFKLIDELDGFYQWDLDRIIIVEDDTVNQVHFSNRTSEISLVVDVLTNEDGTRYAPVPNVLLMEVWDLIVYAWDVNHTKFEEKYKIHKRTKPSDYVYTETEVYTYRKLEDRLDEIESKGISDEQLQRNLEAYFEEYPIEVPEVDLTGYATEIYVTDSIENAINSLDIPSVPTNVSAFNNDVGYLTEHQDLTEYAKKSDIVATDLSNYYTKTEVDSVIDDKIEIQLGVIENGTY
jgi:hypothetical protein